MARAYNFSAGPAVLPEEVLRQAQEEMLDWHGSGMSVMEMSHRGKEFVSIAEQAETDLRELLAVPDNYKVMFLQGGASTQFAMVPLNLLQGKASADYTNTGSWSKKAIAEAKRHCAVNIAGSSEDSKFTTAPPQSELRKRPTSITRLMRLLVVWSSPMYQRREMCRWWRICPPISCHAPLMWPNMVSSMPVPRRISALPG